MLAAAALVAVSLPMLVGTGLAALRAGADAELVERASMHASSMAAAMRASPFAWAMREMAFKVPHAGIAGDAAAVDCARTSCSPEQIVAYDLAQWGEALHESLPGALGTVRCVPRGQCRVAVRWDAAGRASVIALDVVVRGPTRPETTA